MYVGLVTVCCVAQEEMFCIHVWAADPMTRYVHDSSLLWKYLRSKPHYRAFLLAEERWHPEGVRSIRIAGIQPFVTIKEKQAFEAAIQESKNHG